MFLHNLVGFVCFFHWITVGLCYKLGLFLHVSLYSCERKRHRKVRALVYEEVILRVTYVLTLVLSSFTASDTCNPPFTTDLKSFKHRQQQDDQWLSNRFLNICLFSSFLQHVNSSCHVLVTFP